MKNHRITIGCFLFELGISTFNHTATFRRIKLNFKGEGGGGGTCPVCPPLATGLVNDLKQVSHFLKPIMFADDTNFFYTHKSIKNLYSNLIPL